MDSLRLEAADRTIKNISFNNVSFSKKEIVGLRFLNCKFEDCLFIASKFIDCEFHSCEFTYCNTHKIEFRNTYVDPAIFEKMLKRCPGAHKFQYVNVLLHLFQRLSKNSHEMHQHDFAATADFNFRLCKRYELIKRWKADRPKRAIRGYIGIKAIGFYIKWIADTLDWAARGYGWRLGRFFLSSALALGLVVLLNYCFWQTYEFDSVGTAKDGSIHSVLYNTIVIITTLGLGEFNPGTSIGLYAVGAQALFGPIWLSILASILIKRMIR